MATSSDPWDTAGFGGRLWNSLPPPLHTPFWHQPSHFGAPCLTPNCSPNFAPSSESFDPPGSTACPHPPPCFSSFQPPSCYFLTQDTHSSPLLTQEKLLEATLCQLSVHLVYEEFTELPRCCDGQIAGLHLQHALNHEATALLLTQTTRR